MALPHSKITITDNYVCVYGAEIHYLEAGEGSLVILLNGFLGSVGQWLETMKYLAEDFYVIAISQIGFGYSDKPLLNYRIDTLVDFLSGFYQALEIERSALIGTDIGGWVATSLALQKPSLVDRLVLVDANLCSTSYLELPTCATREQTRQLLQRSFYDKDRFVNEKTLDRLFTQKVMTNDGYATQQLLKSISCGEDLLDDRLCQLTASTLIIHGREDELTPLTWSEQLLEKIPNSKFEIIDRCGHLPHVEQPEIFSQIVLEFLRSS